MAGHDIVVIGASMGGVDVLSHLVRRLPPGLPASLFVVCHFPAGVRSRLPEILSRAGPLLASHAADGEPFHPGQIYVAPPDRHLLLQPGQRTELSRGPRENHHRPAVDPLFRSAARHYGRRVIGVVLSGALHDGSAGLLAVRGAGGIAVVQDPNDALAAAMPQSAREIAGADHVVSIAELAPLLVQLIQQPVSTSGEPSMSVSFDQLPDIALGHMAEQIGDHRNGQLATYTYPECGGNLWQVNQDQLVVFRCHVGHVYQAEKLFAEQENALEAALWTAVRTFKERYVLARQLAEREKAIGNAETASRYGEQAELAERYSDLIQRYVLNAVPLSERQSAAPDLPEEPSTKAS